MAVLKKILIKNLRIGLFLGGLFPQEETVGEVTYIKHADNFVINGSDSVIL